MSNQLIETQRYEIYLGFKRKWSKTRIAEEIGVSKSTVSREIRRNSKPDGEYVWKYAQSQCDSRKHGFKGNHRKPDELWWRVEQMIIEEDWSPAQIAGVLRKEGIHICKQTIYNHVHADPAGRLASHMPHELKYTKRTKTLRPTKAANIANRTSIHDRPKEAVESMLYCRMPGQLPPNLQKNSRSQSLRNIVSFKIDSSIPTSTASTMTIFYP